MSLRALNIRVVSLLLHTIFVKRQISFFLELLDFDFFSLPQLPLSPITPSLKDIVIRLEETMSRGFSRLEEKQQVMMEL